MVKPDCTPHKQWWSLYSIFLVFLFLLPFLSFFLFLSSWQVVKWSGMFYVWSCCWKISLCDYLSPISVQWQCCWGFWVLKPEVPIDDAEGKYRKVKESSVNVVSILVCLKINGDPKSTKYPIQLHFRGDSSQEHPVQLCLSVCLCGNCYTWTCVPWACRLCTLDKIFFWWPASVTPILVNSLDKKKI